VSVTPLQHRIVLLVVFCQAESPQRVWTAWLQNGIYVSSQGLIHCYPGVLSVELRRRCYLLLPV